MRLLVLLLLISGSAFASEIAVTFDDLPEVYGGPIERQQRVTNDILAALTSRKIPAVGFVNAIKIRSPQHQALLERWLEAGHELGNHTYSHPDLHRVGAEAFEEDVVKGETPLRAMIETRGGTLRYFRHPFLHTGTSDETRARMDAFFAKHGYTVAPVTIDNSEWIFARAYQVAKEEDRARIADAYVEYMDAKVAYHAREAKALFHRDVRQVLLVHANALNGDAFGRLADRLAKRGHTFVTLERALADPAYDSPDSYRGTGGISWLDRWALTRGVPKEFFKDEPRTPMWVQEIAKIKE
jgi:peptidoglycan/xylan/chitin deacetylase (PgdA/CDA1 family)